MDTLLIVIIIVVVGLVIIGAGFITWGSYQLARRDRRNALPPPIERPADPILPPLPVDRAPNDSSESDYILWGSDGQTELGSKHLRWGEEIEQPPPLPNYPNEGSQCLLTKRPIDKVLDSFIECHNCGVLYLTESWRDYGASECVNCGKELP